MEVLIVTVTFGQFEEESNKTEVEITVKGYKMYFSFKKM